jgi:hypothetical protein
MLSYGIKTTILLLLVMLLTLIICTMPEARADGWILVGGTGLEASHTVYDCDSDILTTTIRVEGASNGTIYAIQCSNLSYSYLNPTNQTIHSDKPIIGQYAIVHKYLCTVIDSVKAQCVLPGGETKQQY